MVWGGTDVIIIEIKYTVNLTHSSHPKTIPPPLQPSVEKLSSTKLVPGAKKIGDHCSLYSNSRALSSFLGCMCLCSNFCALWRKNEKMRQKGEWRVRGEGGKDRREQTHIGRLDEDQIWRDSVYWIPALSTVESHLYLAGETEITIVCYICILVPIPSLRWARWLQ